MIVVFTLIWLDVRRLKHCKKGASSDRTIVPASFSQVVAKMLLSPALANLLLNYLSLVTRFGTVARVSMGFCPVSFFIRQANQQPIQLSPLSLTYQFQI